MGALWPVRAICEAVAPRLPGFTVEVVAEVDSTNSELMRRIRAGRQKPVLLVAERQTAGRGRLGRQWDSGTLAPSDPPAATLAFAAGLALIRAVEAAAPATGLSLKWPNDLWLTDAARTPACARQGERKLGGILIETAAFGGKRFAVIGVGINLMPRDGTGLATAPAWLAELLPAPNAPDVLSSLAAELVSNVKLFETQGFAPFHAAFNARDVLRGRAVLLSDGTAGTAAGVDSSGALLVHTAAGMKVISSAEVSVRPVGPVGPALQAHTATGGA